MKIELRKPLESFRVRPLQKTIAFAIPGAMLLLSVLIPPRLETGFIICFWKNLFHIPCAGCGMTRAFLLLGHGEISLAIRMNPASPLAFTIILFVFINQVSRSFIGKEIKISMNLAEKIIVFIAAAFTMILVWFYNLRCNPWV